MKMPTDSSDFTESRCPITKQFLKAAGCHIKLFLKASGVDKFCSFQNTIPLGFGRPIHMVSSGFRKPFLWQHLRPTKY
jgi:hypothetical protein